MSRRRAAEKRILMPDPVYGEVMISKFVNSVMRDGKKGVAERILYGAVNQIDGKVEGVSGLDVLKGALENVKPTLEVRSRRVGGSTYQIPVEVRESRKLALGIRWMIAAASKRGGQSMKENLASELLDAYGRKGSAVKKKDDIHRMAESNRAFAHYMW